MRKAENVFSPPECDWVLVCDAKVLYDVYFKICFNGSRFV